ncbi:type 4a pilus biogenesis protein PilO [Deinococcus aquiradiocola]|uniref:Pilus assembly protein PilO n=1 Tax=Deinococcus aquiradiocola TaxID=393059 RepID=A0A917PIF1_9DEIO|nr:type 4a pilus biogenesis protein PilO [Deinococcus aquiradiocola]GGJ80491.1 hypothetical protein GCM10008939_25450 [Deinococcus aquiradiocola]
MFAKLSPRNILLLTLAACVVAVLLWWLMYYQTKQQQITDAQNQLNDLNTKLATYRSAQAALPALRTEVAGLQTQRDVFFQALPQTQNIGAVVAAVQQSAAGVGTDLSTLSVAPGTNIGLPAGVRPINLNMTLSGKFQPTFQFLRAVETMNRFSTVSALGLTLPAPDSLDPKLSSTMTMTVYTFDPAAATAAAGAVPNAPAAPAQTPPAGGTR